MAEPPPGDVLLMPVHNRRAVTLAALRALARDGVLTWAVVLVIDDGSTDGTAAAIRAEFPAVEVLAGDGTWWWGGAIRRGMEWALERKAERVFWLNDDCHPPPQGLGALRDAVADGRSVAWIDARSPSGWSYGAQRKTRWSVRRCTPAEEARGQIDTFSGNCVAIPAVLAHRAGLPDDSAFPHGLADLDYGLRLRQAGVPLRPLPGYLAQAAEPPSGATERWLTTRRPLREVWHDFSSPRSFLYFPAWRRFALRHWGPWWGWIVFAAPYVRWTAIAALRAVRGRPEKF